VGEVLDGRAFAQELRIGADGEIGIRPQRADAALDLAAGADRDSRLGGDDDELVQMRCDILDRLVDIAEVGIAVAAPQPRTTDPIWSIQKLAYVDVGGTDYLAATLNSAPDRKSTRLTRRGAS
jgi:hypothetical protein